MNSIKYLVLMSLAVLAFIGPSQANAKVQEWTYEAKMPMHAVYPRPDCETEQYARHRWAHTDMPYEIPIGVQGGAWPFTYTLIEGPEGASIGKTEASDKYGVITWKPSPGDATEQSFRVRVADKAGNNIDITWTVTIDNNKFVFIEDNYVGDKKGTIDAPLEDISDWYLNDRRNKKYHNKIIVFRGGSYLLYGSEKTNGNVRLDANTKTPSLIGYPGEKAVINASQAKIFTDPRKMTDLFIADLTFTDSRQDVGNAHFFWAIGNVTRSTWWRNTFKKHGMGQKGNDNPAGVFVSGTRHHKKYILYKDNFHDEFNNGRANGSYIDIYYSSYVLIESNVAKNSDNRCGFWAKGTTSFVTIRDNHAQENITSGGICVGYGRETQEIPHHHEIAWNKIVFNGKHDRALALEFAGQSSWDGKHHDSYIYRNTFVNGMAWVRFPGKNNYFVDGNVVVNEYPGKWNETIMKTYHSNLTGGRGDFISNENGELVGFAKDYEGSIGYKRK